MPISKNSFDMPLLMKRAKRTLKKKFGKEVSLTECYKVWEDYYTYAILNPLLKHGKVQIDSNLSIEIVGQRIEDNPKLIALLSNGLNKNGIIKDAVKFNNNRPDIAYKIVLIDRNYKGKLIFEANPKLKKAVSESISNTQTHYRILR
jgi:hypothetical protein